MSETTGVGDKRPADETMVSVAPVAQRARLDSPVSDASAWATLPLVAMELVFSYALVDLTVQINPIPMMHHRVVARRVDDALSLRRWSSVCRDWHAVIEQLIAQYQDSTLTLDFVLNEAKQLDEKLVLMTKPKRRILLDLRVAIYRRIAQPLQPGLVSIDWNLVLHGLPNLQRLDLTGMNCLTCEEMCAVLDPASMCCPRLRALVFPLPHGWVRPSCLSYERRFVPNLYKAYKPLLSALATALERWYTNGGSSGSPLEHLVFPCMGDHADEFVSLVTRFVPRIQVLDAWKLAYFNDGWDDVRCDEHWHISKETWTAFCQTCTHLREFNLGLVPPSETFMVPFTTTKKWQLKELTFNYSSCSSPKFTAMNEGLHQFIPRHRLASIGDHIFPPSGISTVNLASLVQVLPRLEVLRINLPSRGEKHLDAFDDDFFGALAKSCPNLKKLTIAGGRGYSGTESLTKITKRGFEVLGKMAKLEELALRPVKILTEDSVAKLLGGPREGRQIDVKLMVSPGVSPSVFKSLMDRITTLMSSKNVSPFALQIAVQERKHRRQFSPNDLLLNSFQPGPLGEVLESLQSTKQELLDSQSRLRFQAFADQHARQLTQVNVFTTDWKLRDGVDTLFFRTEILYDETQRDRFEWIITS